jgi:hypothetical protein
LQWAEDVLRRSQCSNKIILNAPRANWNSLGRNLSAQSII